MESSETFRRGDSRLRDLLMGAPLIIWGGLALAGYVILIPQQWRSANYLQIMAECATAIFLVLQISLLCVRRLPINKAAGFLPRAWAFAGTNFGYAFLLLPRESLGNFTAGLSTSITVAGTLGSVIALFWLGRAFAIFPQARSLVTAGPYAYVRHPLYVFEQMAMIGVALQYRQPWALLLAIVSVGLQFPRMHYEEGVLRKTFPFYEVYARDTPQLFPRPRVRRTKQRRAPL